MDIVFRIDHGFLACLLVVMYEELLRESNALVASQQDEEVVTEKDSSPSFNEIVRLWNKASEQVNHLSIKDSSHSDGFALDRL
jgi:hypothetical protein